MVLETSSVLVLVFSTWRTLVNYIGIRNNVELLLNGEILFSSDVGSIATMAVIAIAAIFVLPQVRLHTL